MEMLASGKSSGAEGTGLSGEMGGTNIAQTTSSWCETAES